MSQSDSPLSEMPRCRHCDSTPSPERFDRFRVFGCGSFISGSSFNQSRDCRLQSLQKRVRELETELAFYKNQVAL